ncbi:MAG: hypothetical protein AAEJ52_16510, partial [Myxococcota bacterium]
LGFYVSGHPLSAVSDLLSRFVDVVSNDTEKFDGREVWVGGLLTSIRETRTRRGALMAFGELEDLEGSFELVVFSEPHAQYGSLMKSAIDGIEETGPVPLLVCGTLESGDTPKILVRQVLPLGRAEERLSKRLDVTVIADEATPDRLTALRDLLQSHRGECAVIVRLVIPGESETLMTLNGTPGVRASTALLEDIDGLFGHRVTQLST